MLSIDDEANGAVYGRDSTPRMIFEGRAGSQPSTAVVDFRDSLEEATALARANRGTDGAAATQVASAANTGTDPGHAGPATATATETVPVGAGPAPTQPPGTFQPVDDQPITSEPLPEDLPAPLPDPID